MHSPHPNSALPLSSPINRCASTHFGENQLAPSSIGISPLTTAHPLVFQHQSVRASIEFHLNFTLAMDRSPGFGSINSDRRLYTTCFRYGFGRPLTRPLPISRRLILQQARGQRFNSPPTACKLTVSCSISPSNGTAFHLSLTVLFTIAYPGVFSLTRWSSQIHTRFHVPHATRVRVFFKIRTNYWTITIYGAGFNRLLHFTNLKISTPPQPHLSRWFRLIPFRSPLLRESLLLSSPLVTKMFQFTRFALAAY